MQKITAVHLNASVTWEAGMQASSRRVRRPYQRLSSGPFITNPDDSLPPATTMTMHVVSAAVERAVR